MNTTTRFSEQLRDVADMLDEAETVTPRVTLTWHRAGDDTIREVISTFRDAMWKAHRSDATGTEWLEATSGAIELVVFARDDRPEATTPRIAALLPEVKA